MNLANLAAMMAAGGISATQSESVMKTGEKLIDTAKVAVVKLELGQIRTAFTTEMAFGNLPKVRANFSQFIRDSMTASGRDPAEDFWGNPYILLEEKTFFEIASFGPDGQDRSDDDIWVEVPK